MAIDGVRRGVSGVGRGGGAGQVAGLGEWVFASPDPHLDSSSSVMCGLYFLTFSTNPSGSFDSWQYLQERGRGKAIRVGTPCCWRSLYQRNKHALRVTLTEGFRTHKFCVSPQSGPRGHCALWAYMLPQRWHRRCKHVPV